MKPPSLRSHRPPIGDLVHRFGVEAPVRTPDGAGGFTVGFTLLAEVWGSLETLAGDEYPTADRLAGQLTHSVWLRWREDVTTDMRLRLGPRVFQVRAVVDHDGRRRFVECRCEETVA